MTARHFYKDVDGTTTELTAYVQRIGYQVAENAEEGSAGMTTVILEDPASALDISGHRRYWITEDDSTGTDKVIFYGFTAEQKISRGAKGEHYEPLARVWSISLVDANAFWLRRVMVGSDCKRPAKTDVARMQWLFGTSEASIFGDVTTYVSTASPTNMDKVDYRGQMLSQVVDDCAQQSGKNWWAGVMWDGAAYQFTAWYGRDSLSAYTSPLSLSNAPEDLVEADLFDGSSLIWPISDDSELTRDPSRVYSGVYIEYEGGALYRHSAATAAAFCRRDFVAPSLNVKTKAKASARAARYLADLDEQDERITTTVILPKAIASQMRSGMRVPYRATHQPGYESYRYCRILSCSPEPVDAGSRWAMHLEMQGIRGSAGVPPYVGSTFAALLNNDQSDGSDQCPTFKFAVDGDHPQGGWDAEPTLGPLTPTAGDSQSGPGATKGKIVASRGMRVRIEGSAQLYLVTAGTYSATWSISTTSGGVVGSVTVSDFTAGIKSYQGFLTIDVEVDLAEGDDVTFDSLLTLGGGSPGGWGAADVSVNTTYLRVGRGTHNWAGQPTWVGP